MFAPLDFTNFSDFPNVVLDIKEWGDILPNFRVDKDDNPAQHLLEFHQCMDQLGIENVHVYSHNWYKSLPHSNISSLKEFNAAFNKYCKRIYPAELIFEDCCNIKFRRHIYVESEHDGGCDQTQEDSLDAYQADEKHEDLQADFGENEYDNFASENEEIMADPENIQEDQSQICCTRENKEDLFVYKEISQVNAHINVHEVFSEGIILFYSEQSQISESYISKSIEYPSYDVDEIDPVVEEFDEELYESFSSLVLREDPIDFIHDDDDGMAALNVNEDQICCNSEEKEDIIASENGEVPMEIFEMNASESLQDR